MHEYDLLYDLKILFCIICMSCLKNLHVEWKKKKIQNWEFITEWSKKLVRLLRVQWNVFFIHNMWGICKLLFPFINLSSLTWEDGTRHWISLARTIISSENIQRQPELSLPWWIEASVRGVSFPWLLSDYAE